MQSGFGANVLFGPENFSKIAGEFLSEFWWRILIANFSALFFQDFTPPKKFTPKLSAFLSDFTFWNPKFIHGDFLLTGETKNYSDSIPRLEKLARVCHVKNATKWVLFYWGKEERSKLRQKYVKNASKMRGTRLGENTFWTIPRLCVSLRIVNQFLRFPG